MSIFSVPVVPIRCIEPISKRRNLILGFLMLLAACGPFAPAFDPVVNDKLAGIEVTALDLKTQCLGLTPQIIHDRLRIPAMEAEASTRYRNDDINRGTTGILKEIISFEKIYKSEEKPAIAYCADKLDDIRLTVDALLKPYGKLQ